MRMTGEDHRRPRRATWKDVDVRGCVDQPDVRRARYRSRKRAGWIRLPEDRIIESDHPKARPAILQRGRFVAEKNHAGSRVGCARGVGADRRLVLPVPQYRKRREPPPYRGGKGLERGQRAGPLGDIARQDDDVRPLAPDDLGRRLRGGGRTRQMNIGELSDTEPNERRRQSADGNRVS